MNQNQIPDTKFAIEILSQQKFSLQNEFVLQNEVEELFIKKNIWYKREFCLDVKNRIDFMLLDGTGIEIKIKGWSPMEIYRQITRYAQFENLKQILFLTAQSVVLPEMINSKTVTVINLGRSWL